MSIRNSFAKGALAAAAGAMAFGAIATAPTFAAAQPYGYNGGYAYDPCQREQTQRATIGGVIGALAGAAIGSNLASHHGGRMGGAVLGGTAGAIGGAAIGNSSAACSRGQVVQPAPRAYNGYTGGTGYYADSRYAPPPPRYGDRDEVTVVEDSTPRADNCTLAESPIYLPDGRIQKRFVRVCQDASGRYQVVD